MRYLIPLVLVAACLASCSQYQYLTLNSSQLTKNDKHQFVFENDTVRLIYDFNGEGGPISINIFNKSSQPLYINWKKSAIIRNEHTLSFYDRNVYFSGNANTTTYRFGNVRGSTTDFGGSFALPEGMDFIPPGSTVSKGLVFLSQSGPMVVQIPDSITQEILKDSYGTRIAKYREKSYGETESPVRFRSYLTFTLGFNNAMEFAESNAFYVGEAIDTKTTPEEFSKYQQQGDKLFIKYQKQQ